MQTTYDGAHSVIFGTKHSWEDWGLVPTSVPIVAPPKPKTNTIDIPGMNGIVDLSEVPLGFPTYQNTTGSFEFQVAHDITGLTWDQTYQQVMAHLHGQTMKVTLTDDHSYYREGRLSVNAFKSDKLASKITINYDFGPYKWMQWTTCGDWLWNPFDFIYGEITQGDFKDIVVDADTYGRTYRWTSNQIGDAPVTPTFTVDSADGNPIHLALHNVNYSTTQYYTIEDGVSTNPLIELQCPRPTDQVILAMYGHGTISIDFRPGRL